MGKKQFSILPYFQLRFKDSPRIRCDIDNVKDVGLGKPGIENYEVWRDAYKTMRLQGAWSDDEIASKSSLATPESIELMEIKVEICVKYV